MDLLDSSSETTEPHSELVEILSTETSPWPQPATISTFTTATCSLLEDLADSARDSIFITTATVWLPALPRPTTMESLASPAPMNKYGTERNVLPDQDLLNLPLLLHLHLHLPPLLLLLLLFQEDKALLPLLLLQSFLDLITSLPALLAHTGTSNSFAAFLALLVAAVVSIASPARLALTDSDCLLLLVYASRSVAMERDSLLNATMATLSTVMVAAAPARSKLDFSAKMDHLTQEIPARLPSPELFHSYLADSPTTTERSSLMWEPTSCLWLS